jgi:hypothetical protein
MERFVAHGRNPHSDTPARVASWPAGPDWPPPDQPVAGGGQTSPAAGGGQTSPAAGGGQTSKAVPAAPPS